MNKIIGIILLILSIVSLHFFFMVAWGVSESSIYGIGALIQYSWIIYFAAIIAILSMLFALLARKKGYKYKKNVIVSSIIIPISLIFGSYRFLFADEYDYTNQIIINVNQKTGLSIPDNDKVVTEIRKEYLLGNGQIVTDKKAFENTLNTDWNTSLSASINNVLPHEVSVQMTLFDHYLFYDCVSNAFNEISIQEEGHSSVFIAYNTSNGKLMLLDNYIYRT